MDAIESLDVGAYSFFRHQLAQPEVLRIMQIAWYFSDYLCVGVLFSSAAFFFLLQRKRRSAQVTAISLAVAIAVLFGMRFLVPRRRPSDAEDWLGPNDMIGSYPSSAVFLFMLAMIFLGFATWRLLRPWMRGLYILLATALTVLVCMSQLILATSYVTDVLGGMAAATFLSWVAFRFLDRESPTPLAARTNEPIGASQGLEKL